MDERLRRLAREAREAPDDLARAGRLLRERLRAGGLSPEGLALLGALGHPAAREALELPPAELPLPLEPWLGALATAPAELRALGAAAIAWDSPLESDRFDGPQDEAIAALDALDQCLRAPGDAGRMEALSQAQAAAEGGWGWRTVTLAQVLRETQLLLSEPWEARGHLGRLVEAAARTSTLAHIQTAVREDLEALLLTGESPLVTRGRRMGLRLGAVPGIVRALALSPDGTRLLVAHRGAARLLELASGRELALIPHERAREVWAAAAHPGGGWWTADDTGALRWFDPEGRPLARITAHPEEAYRLAPLPGGEGVLSAGREGAVALWELPARRERWRVPAHTRGVSALAVAPDGALAASADGEGNLLRWDPARGEVTARACLERGVSALAFLSPARLLVGGDVGVWEWDVATWTTRRRLEGGEGSVYDLAVDPARELAVSVGGGRRHAVYVWDLARGALRAEGLSHAVPLAACCLPEGRGFAVGARNGALRVWSP